jgi:hypothetical protein
MEFRRRLLKFNELPIDLVQQRRDGSESLGQTDQDDL